MAGDQTSTSFSAPLGVVLIGCGRVAEKHLKAISKLKGLELKAVVDVNPDSAKRLLGSVKGFANVKTFTDYKAAIDEIKPSKSVPLRIMTPTMATSAVTPPTEISILPVIMTIVRPQEMMTR